MKKLIFTGVAALMLAATGCKGGVQGENELAMQKDSLATAVGEYFAAGYAQQASYLPDSMQMDKAEVLKGVKAALAADTTRAGQSYLAGLQLGMQMLQATESLSKQSNTTLSKAKILEAFKTAIAPDSIAVNPEEAYGNLMTRMGKVREIALQNDPEVIANKKKTEGFLNELKKKENVKTLDNGLVYEVIAEGDGAKVNATDAIYAIVTAETADGEQLLSTNGIPQQMPASALARYHDSLAEGITAMRQGGHCVFYVNMGVNVPQGMKPYEIVKFDIELSTAEAAAAAQTENGK